MIQTGTIAKLKSRDPDIVWYIVIRNNSLFDDESYDLDLYNTKRGSWSLHWTEKEIRDNFFVIDLE